MKRFLAILVPLALAACQTLPAETQVADPIEVKTVTIEDKSLPADDLPADDVQPVDTGDEELKGPPADDTTDDTKDADEQQTPLPTNFVEYYKSDLILALISEPLKTDDIALMGVVSGARAFCNLRWEPGFITFINAAHQQGLDLNMIADDHGYYHGAAVKALVQAKYACSEQDQIDLRSINPY